jgi:hypothetical protein
MLTKCKRLSCSWIKHHAMMAFEVETSALDGGERTASRSGRFNLRGNRPRYPLHRRMAWAPEPLWTMWRTEKSVTPAGKRLLAVQPVAIPSVQKLVFLIIALQGQRCRGPKKIA